MTRALRRSMLLMLAALVAAPLAAQPGRGVSTQRAAPVMRQEIYRPIRRARSCALEGDFACADAEVHSVFARDDLNSYEKAQVWNVAAFIELNRDDTESAIAAYRNMLAERDVPLGLVRSARYSLATIYTQTGRFDEALEALDGWWEIASPSAPDPFVLRAQIEYRRGEYAASIEAIDEAFTLAGSRGVEAHEGWYQLRAASLQSLGDLEGAAEVLEAMLPLWPTRDYHVQLAGIYSQLGNDVRKRELYETAYASGWLVSGVDLIALAGYRIEAGRLQEALNVLQQNRDRGFMPDGESLRVLIARVQDWASGMPIVDQELETLLRNARIEQQAVGRPRLRRL